MDESFVELTDPGNDIRVLRLNRPTVRNAMSIALREQLSDHIEVLGAHEDVATLVLTGTGQTFCAGFDLKEFDTAAEDPSFNARLWASSDRLHHSLLRCPVPVICALNGPALAGGFDLATLCDLRVAQPGVWFSRPELGFGVPLYEPLKDLIGGALARELCLVDRRVELPEAVRIGLVNRVAERDALDDALAIAEQIARRSKDAIRSTKAKFITAAGIVARPTLAL